MYFSMYFACSQFYITYFLGILDVDDFEFDPLDFEVDAESFSFDVLATSRFLEGVFVFVSESDSRSTLYSLVHFGSDTDVRGSFNK